MPAWKKPKNPITNKEMEFDLNDAAPLAGPLVAIGGPNAIPTIKAGGKQLVERLKREGLKVRDGEGFAPMPKQLMEAMEWVQQKYPRLFGHITDIQTPPAIAKDALGTQRGSIRNPGAGSLGWKLSELGIKPTRGGLFNMARSPEEYAETLGHELLHAKDQLLDRAFETKYKAAAKVLPYKDMPHEIRAAKQGRSTALKFKAAKKGSSGGK